MRKYSANAADSASRILSAAVAFVMAALVLPSPASAARVSGTLLGYESSTPLASRDLHFQNRITLDLYLAPTHTDGSFSQELPPGIYELRAERGAILVDKIVVGESDVALGHVSELAPYAPARLFDLQDIFDSIVTSPAPSTAFIMTVDTTVIPPTAEAVPKPEINWNKLPPGSEAEQNAVPVGETPVPPSPPRAGIGGGNGPQLAPR